MKNSKKWPLVLFLFLQVSFSIAQVTITINSIPTNTPVADDIYLAGNFNSWNPGDSKYKMVKVGSVYSITLPNGTGEAQYKFTRGSWAKVESTVAGANIANRTFTFGSTQTIEPNILGWLDLINGAPDTGSTALKNVSILSNSFYMPQLNRYRRVWIYLPSDYNAAPNKRYPVMYMQDGQNLFDAKTSFTGEWGVDESLVKLEKLGDMGCIVVGIDNGGASRINEYSAFVNPAYGGGQGKEYMRFIVETLKPYIDSVFRTNPDQQHTGLAGSSMGGLISLYGALAYPTVFGKVGVFSPALWFSDSLYEFAKNATVDNGILVYYVAGSAESSTMVSNIKRMDDQLKLKGLNSYQSSMLIQADGAHSEWFWKREFPAAYQFLFNDLNTSLTKEFEARLNKNTQLVPNPASNYTNISSWTFQRLKVLTDSGKEVFRVDVNTGNYKLDVSTFENGIYYVELDFGKTKIIKKLMVAHH